MGIFLRWSEEEAKQAYDLMAAGMTGVQVANSFSLDGKQATRNTIIGLVNRYRKRMGLPKIEAVQPKKPPKPKRERPFRIQKPKVVKSVKVRAYEEAIEPLWVKFMELERHHCRWPVGLGHGLESTYCGHPKAPESSYCNAHTWRAHNDIPREG